MDVEIRGAIRRNNRFRVYEVKSWNLKGENAIKLSEKIKSEGKWKLEGTQVEYGRRWQIVSGCQLGRS